MKIGYAILMILGVGVLIFVHVRLEVWWGKICFYTPVSAIAWNKLPVSIKGIKDLGSFKRAVKMAV